ncbi:NADP-dependent oxidoreductase [Mechercharimyces sp. CAU 1602]|uniref:NADP-dependent oxidoreductase n=1 Tax=Mechercharimyces sp. CAU 1602 TaxID=2973933 RepID=UPI002161CA91|nr:NADP-dependent oxidoreductase [Mechercharimyces sp. CAU 1602]MCS1350851.1 NADP-dependent oxidoreductase [Mechercharimyces sp. CAU 1602]
MSKTNRQIIFAERPVGMPNDSTFRLEESTIPEATEGTFVVQTLYLSVDPYMRGRMRDAKSYIEPFAVNEPLNGGIVARVIQSKHPEYKEGDIVSGMMPWQDYSLTDGSNVLGKLDPELAPISTALGILGMPGLTAYFGLLDIGNPKEGETVVVSGAAGAVGSVVGQIAKIKGCRVVGIAGSDEKNAYLKELGFDHVINYKTENVAAALKESCPDGVDVYFDNVGGEISDAVFALINKFARLIICGQISMYNATKPDIGVRPQVGLIQKSALMKGFVVSDYQDRSLEGITQLATWLREGKLTYRESIVDGLENAPSAFLGLFKGENIGKQLVKVAE